MMGIGFMGCPYCPSFKVHRSQPVTWLQRASVLFLLRLVRCHVCLRQHYRPIFLPTTDSPLSAKKSVRTADGEIGSAQLRNGKASN